MARKVLNCITPRARIALAFILLVLPLRWFAAWLTAAIIHEALHLIAVRLCGGHIRRLKIDINGAMMAATDLGCGSLLFSTLAGPLGCLALVPLTRSFPTLAVCLLLQSVYNLLPIEPLDGGRALRIMCLFVFTPQAAQRICITVKYVLLIIVLLSGLFIHGATFPLFLLLFIRSARNPEKYLANRRRKEYNRESMICEVSL